MPARQLQMPRPAETERLELVMAVTPTSNSVSESMLSAARVFRMRFGGEPAIFGAPGRVNLIGEHTDYNDGFVMPMALGLATHAAIGPREDRSLHVFSTDFDELCVIPLDDNNPAPVKHWSDYVRGVAGVLTALGLKLRGANLVIVGGVPIGSGLSSSAAVEVATAFALLDNSGCSLDRKQIALACQRAENEYAGARCGIMDQFIACFGRAGNALLLDCRSLEYELLAMPQEYRIAICNTGVKHGIASGEYNKRRADCEEAVAYLKSRLPRVDALRDVTFSELEELGRGMREVVFRRARHVITENARVLQASEALVAGEMERFGKLMLASHQSLRDDYEVSCNELNIMVSLAEKIEGVLGARMTGGGFGGCTVNLVRQDSVAGFQREIAAGYQLATGIVPQIYICSAEDGAGRVTRDERKSLA
jgi:galactokinase